MFVLQLSPNGVLKQLFLLLEVAEAWRLEKHDCDAVCDGLNPWTGLGNDWVATLSTGYTVRFSHNSNCNFICSSKLETFVEYWNNYKTIKIACFQSRQTIGLYRKRTLCSLVFLKTACVCVWLMPVDLHTHHLVPIISLNSSLSGTEAICWCYSNCLSLCLCPDKTLLLLCM